VHRIFFPGGSRYHNTGMCGSIQAEFDFVASVLGFLSIQRAVGRRFPREQGAFAGATPWKAPESICPTKREGITETEGLPQARIVMRSRIYASAYSPCDRSAKRNLMATRVLCDLAELRTNRALDLKVSYSQQLLSPLRLPHQRRHG
jgi:hypothetical protein